MEAGNYPVLTNRAPNSTKMSMDASMSNNDNTVQKNNIKNEKEKESKASTTRSSKRENTNTEEMAASTTKSSRRESENREESKASTTRSSKRENTNTEESAASTTKSSRRESENREESAASTTRSSRRENTDREDRSASTTSSLKRENEKREEGKAPNTTSPRKETDDREESAASTVRSSKRENTNREERKTPNTISARKETDNKEGNAASTTRSSRRENTNREESAASTTSSLRRENENREEGKAPNTTSPRKETDNREESADSTTRSSKKETTNREESAASTTRSSRRESENREEGKVPNTTSPRKKTDNREDGTAPNITSTRKETENREESAASTTRSSRRVSENREESTASTTRSSRRENEKREKSQKKNNKQQSKDEVRTLPKPPTNKQPRNSTLQSSIPDGQDPLSKDILPEIRSNTPQAQKNSTSKKWDKKTLVELRASSIIMGLKGIIMVAAIVLISSSEEISRATSCDLEKALKSISLNFTVSCEYDDIKKISTTLRDLGISLLTLNLLFFPLILAFMLLHKICKCLVCILFPFICIFSVFMIMEHDDILYSKTLQTDMNYVQLQSAMAIWLEAHYTSDNISSSDAISNSWNMFFIKYDCCAVNQVTGTTNDFDSTPWCTTAGSCQATASQIPKTCCIGVSEDDYGIAPSDCHSSVNSETFRSNCMNVIKQLSVVNVEECQLSRLQMSLIIIATLELVATAFEITAIIIWIILHKPKFIIKCIKFLCDKTKV